MFTNYFLFFFFFFFLSYLLPFPLSSCLLFFNLNIMYFIVGVRQGRAPYVYPLLQEVWSGKCWGLKILSVLGDWVGARSPQQVRAPFFLLMLSLRLVVQGLLLLGGYNGLLGHHPFVLIKFVVIPGNELDRVVVKRAVSAPVSKVEECHY